MTKTILAAIPKVLKGRGHNRCVPMACDCGSQFLYGISDGTEHRIKDFDTINIACPACGTITTETAASFKDPANIQDGQSGLPDEHARRGGISG
jgi:hypothetical protein